MMVSYVPSYPMTCRPEDVWEAIEFNHENEFFMDVQCRGEYPGYRLKMYERMGINVKRSRKMRIF
jgi:6-phospho-beta-glucosidase